MDPRMQIENSSSVVSSIGHLIKPLIGPRRSVKCIETDGSCRFTSDAILLLEHLDIQHPVGQYIVDVCRCFMAQYKTGGENLLYFICQWTKAATLLCDMGIPSSKVMDILRLAVNDCISHVDSLKQNVGDVTDMVGECKPLQIIGEDDIDNEDQVKERNKNQPTAGSDAVHGTNTLGIEIWSDSTKIDSAYHDSDTKLSSDVLSTTSGSGGKDENLLWNKNSKQCTSVARNCLDILQSSDVNSYSSLEKKNVEMDDDCDRYQLKVNRTSEADADLDDDDVSWFFQDCSNDPKAPTGTSIQTDINKDFSYPGDVQKHLNSFSVVCDSSKNQNEHCHKAVVSSTNSNTHQIIGSWDESKSEKTDVVEVVDSDKADVDSDYNAEDACSTEEELDLCLMKDLQNLKDNIEEDLKLVKNFKTKFAKLKDLKQSDGCDERTSSDFEKYSESDSDSEFDACFETNQSVQESLKSITDINDEFETVQFSFETKAFEITINKGGMQSSNTTSRGAVADMHNGLEICCSKEKNMQLGANLETTSNEDCLSTSRNNCDNSNAKNKQKETGETSDNIHCINSLLANLGKHHPNSSQASVLSNSRHFKSFKDLAEERDLNCSKSVINTDIIDTLCDRKEAGCNTGMENVPTHGVGHNSTTSLIPGCESMVVTCGTASNSTDMHGVHKGDTVKCTSECPVPATQEFSLHVDEMKNQPDLKMNNGKTDFSKLSVRSRHLNEMVAHNDNDSFEREQISELKDQTNNGVGIKDSGSNNCSLGEASRQELKTDRKMGRRVVVGLGYRESRRVSDIVQMIVGRYAQKDGARYVLPEISCYGRCGQQTLSVVEGVIVAAPSYNATAIRPFSRKPCRALLVNADISSTYHHKGYKPIKSTTELSAGSFPGHVTKVDQWLLEIKNILKKLSVEVILARGIISPEVKDLCTSLNIVALETVPYQQLLVLSDATESEMVTYITLATEENVCSEVCLTPWDTDWCDKNIAEHAKQEVVVTMTSRNPVTVVVSELTPALVDLKEQELLGCYQRVRSVYQSGSLVPGGGRTEMACAQFCRQQADRLKPSPGNITDPEHLLPTMFEKLEATFLEYAREMKQDSSHDNDSAAMETNSFFDDYTSKVGAWNMAMDTVCTILNSDWYIITGITADQLKQTHVLTL